MNIAPTASVVIPAHDEQERIGRTLDVLTAGARPGELDIIVVCNGCTDATAEVARQHGAGRVVELATPSKAAALREGDRLACCFPRIYLDADVELTTAAARAMAGALDAGPAAVGGVRAELDLSGSTRPARWFVEFNRRLPVFRDGIIGAGVYALNSGGRARFGTWPDVVADDQLMLRLFAPEERRVLDGHRSRVRGPRDLREVVRRGVRVRRGNQQLDAGGAGAPLEAPRAGVLEALTEVARAPRRWPGAVTFAAVTVIIRARARLVPDAADWDATALPGGTS
jgi:hypothetical protein